MGFGCALVRALGSLGSCMGRPASGRSWGGRRSEAAAGLSRVPLVSGVGAHCLVAHSADDQERLKQTSLRGSLNFQTQVRNAEYGPAHVEVIAHE